MCGRFTQSQDPAKIAKRFKVSSVALEEFKASYNVPPTAKVAVITASDKVRRLESAAWGLKREWAPQIINLQAEKLAKGAFKKLVQARRCLVPVDGFYEWGTEDGKKYPMHFRMKTRELFGFPAIYDEENPKTFAIFTTKPNAVVEKVHHRMPSILKPEQEDFWLDPNNTDVVPLVALLGPYPAELMEGYPVTPAVNSPKNDAPELILPLKGPNR